MYERQFVAMLESFIMAELEAGEARLAVPGMYLLTRSETPLSDSIFK